VTDSREVAVTKRQKAYKTAKVAGDRTRATVMRSASAATALQRGSRFCNQPARRAERSVSQPTPSIAPNSSSAFRYREAIKSGIAGSRLSLAQRNAEDPHKGQHADNPYHGGDDVTGHIGKTRNHVVRRHVGR